MKKKLNRARIGHTRMTYEYFMAKDDLPICQACDTTLTFKHIFEECIQYKKQRKELDISHLIETSFGPNHVNERKTIEFFKTIKILNLIQ